MKTQILLIVCLFIAVSCKKPDSVKEAEKIPVANSFEYREVEDLLEFRKTPDYRKICGVLLQSGYGSKHPEIVFAIGKKKLIKQSGLVGWEEKLIEDNELLHQLVNFPINDESLSLAYGAALVYIVVNENGDPVGYVVPFDKDKGVYYGNDWSSSDLGDIFKKVKKHGVTWEE